MSQTLSKSIEKIIEEEQKVLSDTLKSLMRYTLSLDKSDYEQDILELRDSLSDSRLEDVAAIVAHLERLVLLSAQQQQMQSDGLVNPKSPYFAHLIVEEKEVERHLLIGNQKCISEELSIPIIDWKNAPRSQIFYRYREGEEYQETIGGQEVEGKVIARRTLSIENGVLYRISTDSFTCIYHDNSWEIEDQNSSKMQGGAGLSARPQKQIAPHSRKNNYTRDKHLQEITALIDKDQFDIMTQPDSGIVAIQGGAGSGKTTIALHRLAYMMSLKPHYFVPQKIAVIVFNAALARYFSKILPSLGIHSVQPSEYQRWTHSFRSRYFPKLPKKYTDQTPVSVIEMKRHPAILSWLKEVVSTKEIEFRFALLENSENLPSAEIIPKAWDSLENLPFGIRLLRMLHWTKDQETLRGVPKCPNLAIVTHIQTTVDQMYPSISEHINNLVVQVWEDLFLNEDGLREALQMYALNVFTESQIKEVHSWAVKSYQSRHIKDNIDQRQSFEDSEEHSLLVAEKENPLLDEEDDTLLLLLYQMLIGNFRGKKKKTIHYRHILLDEAQDFSPIEMQLLLNTAPKNKLSVTMAGDFDQQIVVGSITQSWSEMFEYLGLDLTKISPLRIGYRCTYEVMAVAKHIIEPISVNQSWSAVRHGAPVEFFQYPEVGSLIAFLAEALTDLMIREPNASVAVILRYPSQARFFYQALESAEVPDLRLVADQDFAFSSGIEVTDVGQVKGLEFDYVIVPDANDQAYPDDPQSRHFLYVAVTRAVYQLWLMSAVSSPSVLLPSELTQKSYQSSL